MEILGALVGLAVAAFVASKLRFIRLKLGVIIAAFVLSYAALLVFSYFRLLAAEQNCMPHDELRDKQWDREIVFQTVGWGLGYKTGNTSWDDPGNPMIVVDLLGRVVAADPPYVVGAVNRYQRSQLEP
jgi:hypothetical protein